MKKKQIESYSHRENYKFNHMEAFIKQISQGSFDERQVGIYRDDAVKSEIELLERVLKSNNDRLLII